MLGKTIPGSTHAPKYLSGVFGILHRGGCNNFVSGDYQVDEMISECFVVSRKSGKDVS